MVICDLLELRFLDLSDNLISDLPPTIARLQGLESLLLVYNRITRLPDSICGMVHIAFDRWHSLLYTFSAFTSMLQCQYHVSRVVHGVGLFERNRKSIFAQFKGT